MHNKFLDFFDTSTPSKHPVFGKVIRQKWLLRFRRRACFTMMIAHCHTATTRFQVTENFDLVKKIVEVPTRQDKPTTPVVMESITISE